MRAQVGVLHLLQGKRLRRLDGPIIGVVTDDRNAAIADPRLVHGSTRDIDRSTGVAQRFGDSLPDAPASPGHQRNPTAQALHVISGLP